MSVLASTPTSQPGHVAGTGSRTSMENCVVTDVWSGTVRQWRRARAGRDGAAGHASREHLEHPHGTVHVATIFAAFQRIACASSRALIATSPALRDATSDCTKSLNPAMATSKARNLISTSIQLSHAPRWHRSSTSVMTDP